MKKVCGFMAAAALTIVGVTGMHAQDTRESAAKGMRKVEAKEMDPSYTVAAPYAQKLVDESLDKHPEVILLAIHGGYPKYDIIASNFGRIGKLGDEDDLRVIHTGKTNLEVSPKGDHWEAELQLKAKNGKVVGAVGVVFNYKPGDDKEAMHKIAIAIQKEMESKIKSEKQLLGPA